MTRKKVLTAKAKLNESVSSIEDEDKAALCSLNNSQSSGYDSQKRSLKSTPDIRSSQTSNDSFTAIKSQSSTSSRSSAKQVSARASKRSSGRASKTNTTSVYRSHDIRKFFKTTTVKSDDLVRALKPNQSHWEVARRPVQAQQEQQEPPQNWKQGEQGRHWLPLRHPSSAMMNPKVDVLWEQQGLTPVPLELRSS
ncbi:hypothetical protein TYRP_004442 [Tyrophagus putrescentiae]|nr:hypothetical protein TYRP_004442 [Tyrophagus putrescentiae]